MDAIAMVTAGFRWPPLTLPTQYTASATPSPQPVATTIQPALFPLDLLRRTFATTPSPMRMSSAVPISSAVKCDIGYAAEKMNDARIQFKHFCEMTGQRTHFFSTGDG